MPCHPARHPDEDELCGGRLTDKGREQVRRLVEQVRPRRIAGVHCSTMDPAVQSAELAASELGVRPFVADGLQELLVGEPAEDGHAVVQRFKDAVEEIADTHRGETVLVFTHRSVMSLVIPRLSVNVRNDHAAQRLLPDWAPVEVEVDADGWRVTSWPGVADTSTAPGPSSPGGAQNRREPTSSMPLSAS